MKVLITGAFGYLGGRISHNLLKNKNIKLILASTQKKELPIWAKSTELKIIDWENLESLSLACFNVDIVIHTAGINATDSYKNPYEALKVNGLNTCALIQMAIKQRVKKFIYLSTAHVYANHLYGTFNENICPENLHPYAISHKIAEDLVRYYSSRGDILGIVLRISNSFGKPAYISSNCWDLFVNDLCLQAFQSRKMKIHSDLNQRRDFVPISYIIEVIKHFLYYDYNKIDNGVFNLGNGESLSLKEMAEFVSMRFELIRNEIIELEFETNSGCVRNLNFSCEKLKQTGIKPMALDLMKEEIDDLIIYIGRNYKLLNCK